MAMAAACAVCLWLAYGAFLACAYGLLATSWIASANRRCRGSPAPARTCDPRGSGVLGHGVASGDADASDRGPATAATDRSAVCRSSVTLPDCALSGRVAAAHTEPTPAVPWHAKEVHRDHANECGMEPKFALAPSTDSRLVTDTHPTMQSASAMMCGRRFSVTHAAHSTGRHEATYVLHSACAVGICDVIGRALSGATNSGPEMVLIEPDGFITAFWRDGQVPIAGGTNGPLASGDRVTITLDADAGSVHFSVNGIRVAPEMPLPAGGTYAFVTDDRATASTLTMIADRRLRRLTRGPLACS